MRIDLVRINSGVQQRSVYNSKRVSKPVQSGMTLSFEGGDKNLKQFASLTPENIALGLKEAKLGGEGVVGGELPASMNLHEGVEVRSFMPFWEHNNPKGGYKFLIHKEAEYPTDKPLPGNMPAKNFYSAELGETLEDVAKKLNLKESELSYVIQSSPETVDGKLVSRYCILEPTSVKGSITRLSDRVLGEVEEVPYALFKISDRNPSYNLLHNGPTRFPKPEKPEPPHYFLYTPELAKASKPYSYGINGYGSFDAEVSNSDEMRALTRVIHKQMNTEEFGYYNPASVIAHDRVSHTYGNHLANMSALGDTDANGVKVHIVAHNTGRNYQGFTDDPFKMLTIVGDASDAEVLKAHPNFDILAKAKRFGINSDVLTPREKQIAWSVLEPYLRNFRDGAGTYNILKSGISAVRVNPQNISTGTVSYTFDKEMKSHDTPDAAKYLTDDYAAIKTKSALNGCTPANLGLGDPNDSFGKGSLNKLKDGYTPFTYVPESEREAFNEKLKANPDFAKKNQGVTSDIREVISTRIKNGKWVTNAIWEASQKGQDELNKLFLNPEQIKAGSSVLGCLSPLKDGEILVVSWGRPDEQKGYVMTTGGYLEFLKRKDIPTEVKLKVKVLMGAGPWDKNASDYKGIVRDMAEIASLDGGIYKNNFMYVNGWFSRRLVGCATHGMFTSRREMCGITPLECKAAGVPYGVTATGGPVDYTDATNGFLTKEPVEMHPEHYGLSWNNSGQEIDAARVKRQSTQVADIFKDMIEEYTNDNDSYVSKCKTNIEEKIDWHNNLKYNSGKSANRIYMEDIFEYDKPFSSRNQKPLERITGKFGEFRHCAEEMIGNAAKSRPMKFVYAIVGGVAVLSGAYLWYVNSHKKSDKKVDTAA